ncbi:hypothetical protein ES702_04911 [subsurface metagenome]
MLILVNKHNRLYQNGDLEKISISSATNPYNLSDLDK